MLFGISNCSLTETSHLSFIVGGNVASGFEISAIKVANLI